MLILSGGHRGGRCVDAAQDMVELRQRAPTAAAYLGLHGQAHGCILVGAQSELACVAQRENRTLHLGRFLASAHAGATHQDVWHAGAASATTASVQKVVPIHECKCVDGCARREGCLWHCGRHGDRARAVRSPGPGLVHRGT